MTVSVPLAQYNTLLESIADRHAHWFVWFIIFYDSQSALTHFYIAEGNYTDSQHMLNFLNQIKNEKYAVGLIQIQK